MADSATKKWLGLIVLTLALAIVVIDTTLLNVSLSTIIHELNTNVLDLQWVITAYALVIAALTVTGGRLGDLYGRKRMFIVGALIFAAGSLTASYSHSIVSLIWGEAIIEGIGAALMLPSTLSLIVANFKGRDRAVAFGVWGAVAGASSAVGPLLGGYLTTHYSWRWGFRINVFVAALLCIGALWLLAESFDQREKTQLDWVGVLLSALGLLGVTYGIIESATYGWWHVKEIFTMGKYTLDLGNISIVPFFILYGLVFLFFFFLWERSRERRGLTPLVSMSIFRNRAFTAGVVTTGILSLGLTGLIFALPVYLQSVKGLNAFDTGLALLPISVSVFIVGPLSAFISQKLAPRYLIQIGLVLQIISFLVLHAVLKVDTSVAQLIPGLTLLGIGIGLSLPPISNIALSAVSVDQAGEASGINNTFRQLGASLGSAVLGAILLTTLTANFSAAVRKSPLIPPQSKDAIISVVSSPTSTVEFGGAANLSPGAPTYVSTEILSIAKEATTQGNRDVMLYAAGFLVLGILVSFGLPAQVPDHGIPAGGAPVAADSVPDADSDPSEAGESEWVESPADLKRPAAPRPPSRPAQTPPHPDRGDGDFLPPLRPPQKTSGTVEKLPGQELIGL